MMKKINILVLLITIILLVTGCENNTSNKVISNGQKVNTSKMQHKHCTREGSVTNGEVNLNYDIYYTGDILNILKSEETVISNLSSVLDTYENAYKNIHKNYEGLKYYDTSVERTDDRVTSTITINYDQIDIGRLIDIEGEEDNIFENKIPKVEKWITLAKKFGAKCELVEE